MSTPPGGGRREPQRPLGEQAISMAMDLLGKVDPKLLGQASAFLLKARSNRSGGLLGGLVDKATGGGGRKAPPGGPSSSSGLAGQLGDMVRDPSALRGLVDDFTSGSKPARPTAAAPRAAEPVPDNVLVGVAATPGVATGIARVVDGATFPSGLGSGDIVVCKTLPNGWVPMLSGITGVAFETGGAGSQAMRACRQQGIAAVRLDGATTKIADGRQLTLDGGTGRITLGQS